MFRPSLCILSCLFFFSEVTIGSEVVEGRLNVSEAKASTVTLYRDKAFIAQTFNKLPNQQGVLELAGLPMNRQNGSLCLEYRDGNHVIRPDTITWYLGGLDRDNYYRKLVGKTVEVFGSGLNVSVQGKLITFQNGVGLVEGNNGRQYFVDYQDPQGLRVLSREPSETQGKYLKYHTANFGQQKTAGKLHLSYITPLLSYESHYRLSVNASNSAPQTGQLLMKALLSNSSSIDFSNAEIRLVAGDASTAPGMYRKAQMMEASMAADFTNPSERVGEVLVTPLPKQTALPANSRELINLLAKTLTLEKYYILDTYGRNGGRGALMAERPIQYWRFKAPVDLPPAPLRMYDKDSSGVEVIGGQSWMPKATAGEDVWLPIAEALAVRVERSRVEVQQKGDKELQVKWDVKVFNDQKQSVTLLLRERDANLLKLSDVKGAVLDKHNQLKLEVPAGSRKIASYIAIFRR
ncbi:hypothetical protein [uncultured Endozoicomonas sp.]|uniref:hypothetical protein n=1 Tax=uncultured Endozoicomonas sp. TaxID=432652 RepID=UPI0026198E4D|nr:hypothetical protein [uncultured Endozoicomonas sp.]